jgi:Mrp family chromosome partitioning ATPase
MQHEITHAQDWFDDESAPEPAQSVNPLLVVHRCLRGRYALAAMLGIALAVPCAVLGFIAVPPKYTSSGTVNIAPTQSRLIYENEYNEPMSAFESYVQSEAATIQSWRVIQSATQSAPLLAAGWPAGPNGAVDLMEGLDVHVPNRGQNIFVSVTHEDPKLAQAAVDAVLDAYSRLSIDSQAIEMNKKINELDRLARGYRAEADAARTAAFRIAEAEGTDDLERRRQAKHEQVEMLEKLILDYEVELARFNGAEAPAGDRQGTNLAVAPEMLAQHDPELRRLLNQKSAAEFELSSMEQKYAPEHRAVVSMRENIATLDRMIEAQATLVASSGVAAGPSAQSLALNMSKQQLLMGLEELRRLRDLADEQAKRWGKLALAIAQERDRAAQKDEQYEQAQARLNALEVEKRTGTIGRISVSQQASPPLRPSTDRRIPLAVLGALGGGGVGVSVVAMIGFLFPKYRYIGDLDAATRNVFVFGAVPELDAGDPESRELVAASVHQVRSVIDARLLGTSDRALVHLVTSAGAAEGKSTIALRLAKSFAATGRKTLLIDSDMIGRRLSVEFDLLGAPGFADAVTRPETAPASVHATPVHDLFLMPCGRTERVDPAQVSARRAEVMLGALHRDFQAIVVDTGPILGSLEAQAISAVADEVMLVVTRGREVRQVKLAIDRLHRLGARRIGVVFNRATRHDIERSTSISVTSQRASDVRGRWQEPGVNGFAEDDAVVAEESPVQT